MSAEKADIPVIRKLEEFRQRYETVAGQMNRPEVAADPNRIVQLSKEHAAMINRALINRGRPACDMRVTAD